MTTPLSKNNTSVTKRKRSAEDRKKTAVRIVALLLALLMIGSMAYYTVYILTRPVVADEVIETSAESDVVNTSSLKGGEDVLVSVGLMFGENLTTGFQCETTDGYIIGMQELDGDKEFTEIWELDNTVISAASDANLSKNGMTYLVTEKKLNTVIGGYHIQVDFDHLDREEFEKVIKNKERKIEDAGFYLIPSYIYTGYALRIGAFASYENAEDYIDEIKDIFSDEKVSIVSPSETAVLVLNPYTDRILFEYDCGGETEIGLVGREDENGNTYIKTPAGNVYDGVFAFKRHDNGEVDGVVLINILPLEAYVAGVLPYETSNDWLIETLKAFAITVRSYTLTHMSKHSAYDFDLCNTTDCQVYKGAGRINERVMEAVLGTKGEVMTYDGDIITAFYSSSMGGVTVSAQDAWGGVQDYPYLQAVETPWENYMAHNNGFWIYEVSPRALLERLNAAGYDTLEDEIESVEIIELAKNSTYVKKLKFTDIHGNSITITNTDKVRTSLTPYVKSANFVVGKGSVEYTEDVIIDYVAPEPDNGDSDNGDIVYDKDYGYINLEDTYIMTAHSIERNYDNSSVKVMTGNGEIEHDRNDIFVITKENAAAYLGDDYLDYSGDNGEADADDGKTDDGYHTDIIEDESTEDVIYKIAYAENEDNFIFVGKGWGHGVGMSQYGALDMAALGYTAEDILTTYFKDTEVINYRDSNNFEE